MFIGQNIQHQGSISQNLEFEFLAIPQTLKISLSLCLASVIGSRNSPKKTLNFKERVKA